MSSKMSFKVPSPKRHQKILYPGLLLVVIGFCLVFLWPHIYHFIVSSQLSLAPDSKIYHVWRKTLEPPHLEIYFHNWTNPHEGHDPSRKPRFVEVGPFKFREVKEKVNVTWNNNNTVTYRQKKTWWFDEAASCCSLSTNITTLNAILVTMSHKSKDWNYIPRLGMTLTLRAFTPDLHVTKNASDLLFDGYVDQLLALSKDLGLALSPTGRFGWFHGKNDSTAPDGVFNMDVSEERRGVLHRWNTWTDTPYYDGECSKVKGTAGELYSPNQTRNITSFFSSDMCRNVPLDFEDDVDVHGVTGYKYIAYKSLLDNGTLYPENACYCNGDCMPSGVLNVSSCRMGSPTFLSLPHFLHADPYYTRSVEGMRPDKDKHQLFIVLEPNTGIPIQSAARIQLNMHLKPVSMITVINDVPDVMFPILWFQVQMKASESFAGKLRLLLGLPKILKTISLVVLFVGVLIVAVAFYVRTKRPKTRDDFREHVPLQSKDVY